MADRPDETPRPARPLSGYQDAAGGGRWSRGVGDPCLDHPGSDRGLVYLAWTLTVYFLEPGLR